MKKRKTLSAYNARGTEQVCSLRRDNIGDDVGWIITDGYHVTVAKQKPGEEAETMTTLPRKTFNKLVRWYMREQKL